MRIKKQKKNKKKKSDKRIHVTKSHRKTPPLNLPIANDYPDDKLQSNSQAPDMAPLLSVATFMHELTADVAASMQNHNRLNTISQVASTGHKYR